MTAASPASAAPGTARYAAYAAAGWAVGRGPAVTAALPDEQVGRPYLLVCQVATAAAAATLVGLGTVASGARLVRILGHETASGPGAAWFAQRAGAGDGHAADLAAMVGAGGARLSELLRQAAERPRIRGSAVAAFGPASEFRLTLGDLLDGSGPVGATAEAAVRAVLERRADLFTGRDAPGSVGTAGGGPMLQGLVVGPLGVLPWLATAVRAAAVERLAAVDRLAATGATAAVEILAADDPSGAAARGDELVAAGRAHVVDRCERAVRLYTHQVRDGRLAEATIAVAAAGDAWPERVTTDAGPLLVRVDGDAAVEIAVEVRPADSGPARRARLRLPGGLAAGDYHVGLRPGRYPAGGLVLSPAGGGEARVLEIPADPDNEHPRI
ncbi:MULTISPECIES: hypothetical protein [Frankia]|uniref:hypothetical protein n=2 Tax=Frankiaceae TaxID=74712 RepID=UPI0002EDF1D9|nr:MULTISPECIES: hypothetical protein [Frankia]